MTHACCSACCGACCSARLWHFDVYCCNPVRGRPLLRAVCASLGVYGTMELESGSVLDVHVSFRATFCSCSWRCTPASQPLRRARLLLPEDCPAVGRALFCAMHPIQPTVSSTSICSQPRSRRGVAVGEPWWGRKNTAPALVSPPCLASTAHGLTLFL